jgi:hypothetical protein
MLRAKCPDPRLLTCALTVAAVLWGSVGCRQIFGVSKFHAEVRGEDSGSPDGRAVASSVIAFRDVRCTSCMTDRCRAEVKECLDEPTCKDFWTCRAGCEAGDGTCQNTCRSRAWPWNGGAYRVHQTGELEACLANACDSACKQRHVFGTQACMSCVSSQCDNVDLKAHTADVDAQHLESCDARCVAITQPDARRLAYCDCATETGASKEAVTRWTARQTCTTVTCGAQCNGLQNTPDLDCLGTSTFVSAIPDTAIDYRLVAYGMTRQSEVETSIASACTLTVPDCSATHGGPYPLTFLPEHHFMDAGSQSGSVDFAGNAHFTLMFQTTFEPYADHMEVRVGGYRNLLYEVPLLQQDKLTVWWPVASRADLQAKLVNFEPEPMAAASGSFLVVIVADCEGRALPGVQLSARSVGKAGVVVASFDAGRSLEAVYPLGDHQTGTSGIAFFYGVPPGTVEVIATYQGRFHSKGQVLIVADGSTLIGLGPSWPPPG